MFTLHVRSSLPLKIVPSLEKTSVFTLKSCILMLALLCVDLTQYQQVTGLPGAPGPA